MIGLFDAYLLHRSVLHDDHWMYTALIRRYWLIETNISSINVIPLHLPAYIFHSTANETDDKC